MEVLKRKLRGFLLGGLLACTLSLGAKHLADSHFDPERTGVRRPLFFDQIVNRSRQAGALQQFLQRRLEILRTVAASGGIERLIGQNQPLHDALGRMHSAIEVNGRIGVLYSNKDYGCEWDYDFRNKRWYKIDNTRFGVNIIMYALTS